MPKDVSENTIKQVLKEYHSAGLEIWNSLPEETKLEINKKSVNKDFFNTDKGLMSMN